MPRKESLLFRLGATFAAGWIATAWPGGGIAATVVNDVTNINPVTVDRVLRPTTSEQIKAAVKAHPGPISIGGGRFSMGGQTATEKALQIDLRDFKKILKVDLEKRQVTVQSGVRWRDIHDEIDRHDLAIKIMQTYANFTVGGSLSVNAHGRYIGEGPLVRSVESIKIVLADGSEVPASRAENKELFQAAIGGYGGIGIITEATLNLVPNEKIRREVRVMPVAEYRKYFQENVRDNKAAVLHNADIYPPGYESLSAITWYRTDKPLTVTDKLIPRGKKYWLEPNVISMLSLIPFGTEIRSKFLDPIINKDEAVVWRNYEASYDVAGLEPSTPRLLWTYVLQEYFVPASQLEAFIPKMRAVFQKYGVNVFNVSIRHALPDTETYLAWAPEEVFSFVVYYKQRTSAAAKREVAKWTKEMIDQVLAVNGRHYLPYQIHATPAQFKQAYPGHVAFFAKKKKADPTNKFRNKLWDAYYE